MNFFQFLLDLFFPRKATASEAPAPAPVAVPEPQPVARPTPQPEPPVNGDRARFDKFIPWILGWETEYDSHHQVLVERDPSDPGGTTKYGIDARSHPHVDIPNLTKDGAIAIYWSEWQTEGCSKYAYPLGEVIFNCNVNCGTGRTAKILAAIHPATPKGFIDEQAKFYRSLAAERPSSAKYLKGWLNRLNDLSKTIGLG